MKKFARGGIVNGPRLFPMANGMGLMGEAGPEAIMPLKRGPGGRLGVESSGGGAYNITVNVNNASDDGSAKRTGRIVASEIKTMIDQRLIYQSKPGGILRPQPAMRR
jgi:phage-related minor tail protein